MQKRVGILGPFQLAEMGVHDEVVNMPMLLEKLPGLDSRNLTYACLIQAGLDRLEIASTFHEDLPTSPALLERVSFSPSSRWVQAFLVVQGLFSRYMPDHDVKNKEALGLGPLFRFLVDLLFALAERKALVCLSRLPNLEAIRQNLPPEILLPVSSLMSMFERLSVQSPVAAVTVDVDSVARFQEVTTSGLYRAYVRSHQALDDSSAPAAHLSNAITSAADALCGRYRRYLRRRRLAAALLPISAKLVDKVLGDLPGDVADFAAASAEGVLRARQRLVIYEMDETIANSNARSS